MKANWFISFENGEIRNVTDQIESEIGSTDSENNGAVMLAENICENEGAIDFYAEY